MKFIVVFYTTFLYVGGWYLAHWIMRTSDEKVFALSFFRGKPVFFMFFGGKKYSKFNQFNFAIIYNDLVFFFTYYLFTIVPPNIYHSFQLVVQLSILSYYSLPRIFHSLFNIAYHLLLFIVISYRTFLLFLFLTIIYLLSNIDCRHLLLFIIIYRYLSSAYSRSLSPSSLVTFLFRCVCRAHDDNIVE